MSFKFFSFSKLRKFLNQDLTSLSSKRYRRGYRQTYACEDCSDIIYAKSFLDTSTCECGRFSIEENSYYYKFVDSFDKNNTNHSKVSSVLYSGLRENKC